MFQIAKLNNVQKENITINYVTHETYTIHKGKTDSFRTLSFCIDGEINKKNYSFSFDLNCKLKELLKIENGKTIDFKKYIFDSETFLTVNGITDLNPTYYITINRWFKNKFEINIQFFSDILTFNENNYSGIIQFDFNLNDYISTKK